MKNQLIQRLRANLELATIASCSEWTERYRIMAGEVPGPFSFAHAPWLREIQDGPQRFKIAQKAAQLGFTEAAINKCFYLNDVKKRNAMYVLANKRPMCSEFSQSRFAPALALSPHIKAMYNATDNTFVKTAGIASLFIRGARSPHELKSVPASFIVLDEVDEMMQENIPLAWERTAGQAEWEIYMLSTPTVEGHGISKYYEDTDKRHFFFKCPHCSRLIELKWPESFVLCGNSINDPDIHRSHIICHECKTPLRHEDKRYFMADGIWVPSITAPMERAGYYLNQMYSVPKHPSRIAEMVFGAKNNPAIEQQLYNSALGLPHMVSGSQITRQDMNNCLGELDQVFGRTNPRQILTMGVDVGKVIHYEIDEWFPAPQLSVAGGYPFVPRVIRAGTVDTFEELAAVFRAFWPNACVIDKDPETRAASSFASMFPDVVFLCDYVEGIVGKSVKRVTGSPYIKVDRTQWLDIALPRYKAKTIQLPRDISQEFVDHHTNVARIYRMDRDGRYVVRYIAKGPDHYAHARCYAEIALKMLVEGADSYVKPEEEE